MMASVKAALKDEMKFLFPYQMLAFLVPIVVTVLLGTLLSSNTHHHAPVAVIDLDNSRYSRELIGKFAASPEMEITAVLNTPVEPKTLFYQDANIAVIYLPQGLEKDRYTNRATNIGVFYDNINTGETGDLKSALNELVALDNIEISGNDESDRSLYGVMQLQARNLFNPQASGSNNTVLGFLFFFSSMYFVFGTIGMMARLRMTGTLAKILEEGNPLALMARLIPYQMLFLMGTSVGLVIMRLFFDLSFMGHFATYLFVQVFYIGTLGLCCHLMGWTASNPGIASARMILFLPGGFILGGATGPTSGMWDWVVTLSHIFPLTWEHHFARDIISRGAGFMDMAGIFGAFLIYVAVIVGIYLFVFNRARENAMHTPAEAMPQEAVTER
ncbi:ABC transporter permease [Selenomonas sp. TAMA-11512]|uniref:ABC transporter permease n=1 Tax=Selenomonas sp. TAMA-11512 TaxID=3095337 RepID=UPI00308B886B|nr:ABC transporter permease [Selenomonas sp. TAMA-11512]